MASRGSAQHSALAAGRQIQADFLNGTRSEWIYTDAGQIDWIKHWSPADGNGVRTPTLHLDYGYNSDGSIATINQIDATGSYLLTYEYGSEKGMGRKRG